jgi:hypothetical protein
MRPTRRPYSGPWPRRSVKRILVIRVRIVRRSAITKYNRRDRRDAQTAEKCLDRILSSLRLGVSASLRFSRPRVMRTHPRYLDRLAGPCRPGTGGAASPVSPQPFHSLPTLSSLPPPHLYFSGGCRGGIPPCIRAFKSTNQKPSPPRPLTPKINLPNPSSTILPPTEKSCPTKSPSVYL